MDEHPDILEIIKEEGDTRAFGEVWHTDQMFNPKPAKATILYAKGRLMRVAIRCLPTCTSLTTRYPIR